ncbi:MAG TPA: SDR family NAD(P)-dependent oxidoreductase, partial [Anaerolineales bacterium]|nr:SDR family NAD(P)-dependent oxidoreductase [Anaerolineales bacterium]
TLLHWMPRKRSMADKTDFAARYGPWGIVAGASEGLGAQYANQLAARGLNLVLVARREELLQSLSSELSKKYQVETKIIALDLSAVDAAEQIAQATNDLEIGLLIYNAAFSAIGPFLERPIDDHLKEIHTNAFTPLKLVYLFARRMLARGCGGIVLMSSLSAFQGSAYISTYAATKAFNIVLAEGLWEEWRQRGVDVLVCISGAIRTPNYLASEPEQTGGLGDMTMKPDQVVREALHALGKQPYVIPGRMNSISSFVMRHLLPRKATVKMMGRILRKMYANNDG